MQGSSALRVALKPVETLGGPFEVRRAALFSEHLRKEGAGFVVEKIPFFTR